MGPQTIQNNDQPALIPLSDWLRQIGRSGTTGWRWVKAGWLHPVNIAGRLYLTGVDIAQFQARAVAGEFSKELTGASAASTKARAEKEAGK
jgi:hypothetical protein